MAKSVVNGDADDTQERAEEKREKAQRAGHQQADKWAQITKRDAKINAGFLIRLAWKWLQARILLWRRHV